MAAAAQGARRELASALASSATSFRSARSRAGPASPARAAPAPRAPARCRWRRASPHGRRAAAPPSATRRRARRSHGRSTRRRRRSRRGRNRARNRGRCRPRSGRARDTSPSATATPSALAARDRPIDFSVSRVAVVCAAPLRRGDALGGQQRAFDLHEMHVGRRGEAGVGDGPQHALGDAVDLREPAEVLRRERRRARAAQRERGRRAGASSVSRASSTRKCGLSAPSVPPDMTRQTCAGSAPARASASDKRARRKPAREIVDAAIALGLAEDRRPPPAAEWRPKRTPPPARRRRRARGRTGDARRRVGSRQARDERFANSPPRRTRRPAS